MTSEPSQKTQKEIVSVEKIESEKEIEECFEVMSFAFGTEKPMFNAMYPEHETTKGREKGKQRLSEQWKKNKDDKDFHFLKATIKDQIVGFAIWIIMDAKKNLESENAKEEFNLEEMYPDQPLAQEWLRALWPIYIKQRRQIVLQTSDPRPVIALELCAVRPEFQRKGVGKLLSGWGVKYGKQIGVREAVLEASVVGVGCYASVGFIHRSPIEFTSVDQSLTQVQKFPTLFFMRTGPL